MKVDKLHKYMDFMMNVFKNMETLQKILLVITIVGAVNWGLIGLFDFDLVAFIFGLVVGLLMQKKTKIG